MKVLRRRLVAVAGAASLIAFSFSAPAQAATPVAGITYSGLTAHGRYTVSVATSCTSAANDATAVCAQPGYATVMVNPTKAAGAKCGSYGFNMGTAKLKADGSFSIVDYSANTYDVKLSGRFPASDELKGSLTNAGCPPDSFDIKLKLVSPLSPCEILAKAHAARTMDNGAATIETNEFTATAGECEIAVGKVQSTLELELASSRSTLPVEDGGMTGHAVGGPGVGASLYSSPTGNSFDAIVVFHHGLSWADVNYDFQRAPCPSSTRAGATCVPSATQAAIVRHVEYIAKQTYSLL